MLYLYGIIRLSMGSGTYILYTISNTMTDIEQLIEDNSTEENYIYDLYNRLASGKGTRGLYLPHSDVYYVRNAIHKKFGILLTCKEVQKMMEEECGWDR